jgi:hypothetical protein
MHPWKSWLALGLLAAFAVQAGVIYKWVDADGVVHYSDQPSPGAEKIYTSSSSSAAAAATRPSGSQQQLPQAPQPSGLGYSEFAITAPTSDQTFFGDDVVFVNLTLVPSLRGNHGIIWHLNGRQLDAPPNPVAFPLPHLDRGTYTIAATVTDQNTGETQSSNSVTFFVRQPSALSPQHR